MDRVPYKPDTSSSEVASRSPQSPSVGGGNVSYMDDMKYHKMANFFDISYDDRRDLRVAEKLSFLTDWAMRRGAKDEIDALGILKGTIRELGLSVKGNDLVKKLYEFSRLENQRQKIDSEINLYKENVTPETIKKPTDKKLGMRAVQNIVKREVAKAKREVRATLRKEATKEKPVEQPIQQETPINYYPYGPQT